MRNYEGGAVGHEAVQGLLKGIEDDSAALTLTKEQNPKGLKFEENQPEILVQLIDDPKVDLAVQPATLGTPSWVEPLHEPLPAPDKLHEPQDDEPDDL